MGNEDGNCTCVIDIVIVRHGESEWNVRNLYCGWYDAELTEAGIQEARTAGETLKKAGLMFDIAYTSLLKRAQNTLLNILAVQGQKDLPIVKTWRLNERHYGALTGMNKVETVRKFGEDQVAIWRRSFDVAPPPMEKGHRYYDTITKNPSLVASLKPDQFPKTESLKSTIDRILPLWKDVLIPKLRAKTRILIVAHNNSLRGLVKHIEGISDQDITTYNLPTGIPIKYSLDPNMRPIAPLEYLGHQGHQYVLQKALEKYNLTEEKA